MTTIGRVAFPATPDETWTPDVRARWETAREIADAMTAAGGALDRYGWHVESAGRIPGMRRCLGLWVLAPFAGVGTVHLLSPLLGLMWACYAAIAVGAAAVLLGAQITLRADKANHPPKPREEVMGDLVDAEVRAGPASVLVAASVSIPRAH